MEVEVRGEFSLFSASISTSCESNCQDLYFPPLAADPYSKSRKQRNAPAFTATTSATEQMSSRVFRSCWYIVCWKGRNVCIGKLKKLQVKKASCPFPMRPVQL